MAEVIPAMDEELNIRAYRPGDEVQVLELFSRCFGKSISAAHWAWKMQSVSVDYTTVWLATCGDRIVGQYVGTPVEAWVDGVRRPAIAIFDTMVDPGMRRKGVLTRVGAHAHRHWQDADVSFGYGLPNQNWGSRAAALGWVPAFPLRWLERVLRPEAILARRLRIPGLARLAVVGDAYRSLRRGHGEHDGITVADLDAATADLDHVAELARPADKVSIVRGARWVDLRYLRCPSTAYSVLLAKQDGSPRGYAVYRYDAEPHARATITELVCEDDDTPVAAALLAAIEARCLRLGAVRLRCVAAADSGIDHHLRQHGFFARRGEFLFQYVPLDAALADRRSASHWSIQGGDFDVV